MNWLALALLPWLILWMARRTSKAGRHTTASRIKVNRSAVRARASTTQTTPPSSPWARRDTASGPAASGFSSADLQAALKARGLTLVPAVEPITSTSVRQDSKLFAPAPAAAPLSSGGSKNLALEGDIP